MIKRIYFLFILLVSQVGMTWVPPESFDSAYIEVEEAILSATIKGHFKTATDSLQNKLVDQIINDYQNKVNDDFNIPKYFESSVRFWFSIYTQYNSDQIVIHDSEELGLTYNVIDFGELESHSKIHRFAKAKLRSHLSNEYIKRIKNILTSLSKKNLSKLTREEDQILKSIKNAQVKIPKKKYQKEFFKKLADNIRTQTGQRDKIFAGVVRSKPYLPFIEKQLKNFKLPKEMISIAFLESSFNIKAKSKVAASGIWQFMPFIGNLFMPKINKYSDYRQNPIISTLASFHLMKENKLILKRWDLAVPAYNSGPKHLKRAIKKLSKKKKEKDIGLDYILENYSHEHIGFASKNFFSEFLALTRVLAYKDLIYPLKGIADDTSFTDPANIGVYVTKCKVNARRYLKLLSKNSPKIDELNYHFKIKNHIYPRGTLVVSDRKLNKKKYYKISDKEFKKRFPKNYYTFIRRQKCNR